MSERRKRGKTDEEFAEWFWMRLSEPDANGCRHWLGVVGKKDGRGNVFWRGRLWRAHRVAYNPCSR